VLAELAQLATQAEVQVVAFLPLILTLLLVVEAEVLLLGLLLVLMVVLAVELEQTHRLVVALETVEAIRLQREPMVVRLVEQAHST
jgi:hypothetical protein